MILVYSNIISSRLEYTLKVVFNTILKVDFRIVDLGTFKKKTNSPRINYSPEKISNCLQIIPEGLLSQENIISKNIEVKWENTTPYFFKTSENNILNFDIIASTFYMIARYEEYFPSKLDSHNRFKAENSLAFKNDFLKRPVVNIWVHKLKLELEKKYPDLLFPKQQFTSINSIDIDIAYAYKGKNVFRLVGSTIKALLNFDTKELTNRYNYFIKGQADPYDSYFKIFDLNKKHKTKSIFFFQLGNYKKYDKNLHWKSKTYKKLINSISSKNEIGVHPSYYSNHNMSHLNLEKQRLEIISEQKITKSRQHFLKFTLPFTYENLISIGIEEDYTMGFASQIGFRAGICTPYPFFNLKTNQERALIIYPFQIMDGTLKYYLRLSPNESLNEIKKVVEEVKKVNGLFISLWHNSSINKNHDYESWIRVYEKMLENLST